ncbi:MAG: AraC family transcriptional regulator [Gemmatimonadota bacterium]|nr:MAG: AraC family transcriptional regulator [Gemmatimonadota bacterium]
MSSRRISADYVRRVNRVIDHVLDHLDETLSLDCLAQIACFSPFHFHRIFSAVQGESLHDFVKRMRLERAAALIKNGDRRSLTAIALTCGFGSSADFSKSFKKHFGFPPSQFDRDRLDAMLATRGEDRDVLCALRSTTPFADDEFEVSISQEPALHVVYIRIADPISGDNLARGYDRLIDFGRARGLLDQATQIGVSQDDLEITPVDKLRYDFCLTVPAGTRGAGEICTRVIPGGDYASLHIAGDLERVARGWDFLYRHWLLRSRYQPSPEPAMEVYRRTPLELGWEVYDLDARIPVVAL